METSSPYCSVIIRSMMEHPEWITLSAGLLEKIQPALLNAADTGALQLDESILQEIMSLMDEVKPYEPKYQLDCCLIGNRRSRHAILDHQPKGMNGPESPTKG